jgi:hypothetical protein
MAREFYVMKEEDGKPIAIFLSDKNKLRITSPFKEIFDQWGKYVEKNPFWAEHVKTGTALSSLFGKMTYISGEAKEYNSRTALEYEKIVKQVGGKSQDFSPKKATRSGNSNKTTDK